VSGIVDVYLYIAVFKIELIPNSKFRRKLYQKYSKIDSMTVIESVLALVISISTIITSAAFGVRWLTKHYFDEIKHEMKPNGGSSMKDQVNRIEKDIEDLKNQNLKGEDYHEKLDNKIDELTKLFVEYVARQK
jgi:hypothetical protein